MLEPNGLARMKKLGESGDGRAAYLVFQHYSFGLDDQVRSRYWLEKSVDAGFPTAVEAIATLRKMEN